MPFLREAMSRAWPEWQALALIWPHDRSDIYGECRGSEQTMSASLPTRQTLYMAGMACRHGGNCCFQ